MNSILIFSGKRRKKPKHLCLDKGYDFKDIEVLIKRRNIQSHIRKSLSLVNIKENLDDGSLKELTVGTIDSGLSLSVGKENLKIIWLLFISRALSLLLIFLIGSFETGSNVKSIFISLFYLKFA
ncbi:hypothetical protein LEP1GSC126_3561 [Leptospira kirschneri str. 200801774]|nr:hypothetical protein LEP1GSC126_3561 [Leptospira kirschneri str. 200801774]